MVMFRHAMIIVIVRTKMIRSVQQLVIAMDACISLYPLSSGVSALDTLLYNLVVYVRQLRADTACSTANDDG